MSNAMLYAEISLLPDNLKSEVADFVARALNATSAPGLSAPAQRADKTKLAEQLLPL